MSKIEVLYFLKENCPFCIKFNNTWTKLQSTVFSGDMFDCRRLSSSDKGNMELFKEYGITSVPSIKMIIRDNVVTLDTNLLEEDMGKMNLDSNSSVGISRSINSSRDNDDKEDRDNGGENRDSVSGKTHKLIYFRMPGCGFCKAFDPTWAKIKEYSTTGKVEFVVYNLGEQDDKIREYGVNSYPTLLFVNKKKVLTCDTDKLAENVDKIKNIFHSSDLIDWIKLNSNNNQNGGSISQSRYMNKYAKYKIKYLNLKNNM